MQLKIGERFKKYESPFESQLPPRMPVIIRVDGRAFHTLTKKTPYIAKPFCSIFNEAMIQATNALCTETHAVMAYAQSDEISLLLLNDRKYETQPWFNNEINKMISITASVASVAFSQFLTRYVNGWGESWEAMGEGISVPETKQQITAHFDSRVFVVPNYEIENYFIWRQLDAIRNARNSWSEFTLGDKIGRKTARKKLHGMNGEARVELVEEETGEKFESVSGCFVYGTEVIPTDEGYKENAAPFYVDNKEHIQSVVNRYYEKE